MRRILFVVGVTAAVAVVAAGCGSSSTSQTTTAVNLLSGKLAATSTPAPTGSGTISKITWNLVTGEPYSLDPIYAWDESTGAVISNLCEPLVREEPNGHFEPWLATYTHPNPTTWVYNIRPNANFWNGQPVTAADAVFSLDRAFYGATSYWNQPEFWKNVSSIKATGVKQVTITLKKPDYLVNQLLALVGGDVLDESYVKAKGSSYGSATGGVMCSGPYELAKWTAGSDVLIKANPHYWNSAIKPRVKEVDFVFLTNDANSTSAILAGQVQGEYDVPPDSIARLDSSSVGKVYTGRSTEAQDILVTTSKGPLANVSVRHALFMAIDRNAMAQNVFAGTASPAKTLIMPDMWTYETAEFEKAYNNLPETSYDVAAARKLVKAAGDAGKTITLMSVAGSSLTVEPAEIVQAAGKAIGLSIKLHQVSPDQATAYYASASLRNRYHLSGLIEDWSFDMFDPLYALVEVAESDSYVDYSGYDNPVVDKDINLARSTPSLAKRAQYVIAAQAAWTKDLPWIPMVNNAERMYMSNTITGAPPTQVAAQYYPWAAMIGPKS